MILPGDPGGHQHGEGRHAGYPPGLGGGTELEGVAQPRIRKDSLGWLAMKEPMGMGPILRE